MRVSWRFADEQIAYTSEHLATGITIADVDWGVSPSSVIGRPDPNYVDVERHRAIPLRPIWTGLAANALLFTLPWLIIIAPLPLAAAWRRRRRRRKHLCIACRYPRPDETDRCPECGRAFTDRAPLVGPRSLIALVTLNSLLVSAIAAFAVWRAHAVTPMPPLHLAAAKGDVASINRLIAEGADPDELLTWDVTLYGHLLSEAPPIAWAAARGHVEAVQALLDAGADPNIAEYSFDTPIALAAKYCHPEVCKALLDAGAEVAPSLKRQSSSTTLSSATGCYECFALMLEAGSERARPDAALLHRAVCYNPDRDVINRLIAEGVNIDARMQHGQTPLIKAVMCGKIVAIQTLLDGGADPALTDENGNTALDYARGGISQYGRPVRIDWAPPASKDIIETLERALAEH
jgi:ankyrin repeat protein